VLSLEVQDVDVSLEESDEAFLVIWSVFFVNHDFACLQIVGQLCLDVFSSTNAGDQAESVLPPLGLLRHELGRLLQELCSKVRLSISRQKTVQALERTDIIIEVQNLVSEQILVHGKGDLYLLCYIYDCKLCRTLLVIEACASFQECFETVESGLLCPWHVQFNLRLARACPKGSNYARNISFIEDSLDLCAQLVERQIIQMLPQDGVIDHDHIMHVNSVNIFVADVCQVVEDVQLFFDSGWTLEED